MFHYFQLEIFYCAVFLKRLSRQQGNVNKDDKNNDLKKNLKSHFLLLSFVLLFIGWEGYSQYFAYRAIVRINFKDIGYIKFISS